MIRASATLLLACVLLGCEGQGELLTQLELETVDAGRDASPFARGQRADDPRGGDEPIVIAPDPGPSDDPGPNPDHDAASEPGDEDPSDDAPPPADPDAAIELPPDEPPPDEPPPDEPPRDEPPPDEPPPAEPPHDEPPPAEPDAAVEPPPDEPPPDEPPPDEPPPDEPPPPPADPCGEPAERAVVDLANQARAEAGLGPFRCEAAMTLAARLHSQDMCDQGYFAHTSLDGRQPWDRMRAQGVQFGAAGENIGQGYRDAAAAHGGWMNSPGHRANLLSGGFNRIGVGYAPCGGAHYWTQVFAD